MEQLSLEKKRVGPEAGDPNSPDRVDLIGSTKILIGGFDNAGKSTLACSLYKAMEGMGYQTSLYELDRWSDTHGPILGNKSWKERCKRTGITEAEYAEYAAGFIGDSTTLVLGDIEGKYQNPHSRCLKGQANIGIMLTRDPIAKDQTTEFLQTVEGWEQLFTDIDISTVIRVHSSLRPQPDSDQVIAISGLERSLVPNHPKIQLIARKIIDLATRLQ